MSKTIEEKARAYDKALEKAREYWETDDDNTLDIKARGTMEYLFPELAESEDKKIIKEILEVAKTVVSCDGTLYGKKYNCREWIAWLEKQGEQKVPVVDFKAEDWYVSKVDGKIHNATFMEKTPTNQASEKQGEQKPQYDKPAWSEEDEKNLQGIIDEIQANKNNAPSYDIPVYEGFLNWYKSLKQRIGG